MQEVIDILGVNKVIEVHYSKGYLLSYTLHRGMPLAVSVFREVLSNISNIVGYDLVLVTEFEDTFLETLDNYENNNYLAICITEDIVSIDTYIRHHKARYGWEHGFSEVPSDIQRVITDSKAVITKFEEAGYEVFLNEWINGVGDRVIVFTKKKGEIN